MEAALPLSVRVFRTSQALPSILALLAANLLPLIGVLFLGWRLGLILLLYWAESAVLLGFNLLKMLRMGVKGVAAAGFFTLHAGMFMLVHLVFLLTLFDPVGDRPVRALASDLALPLAGLVLSHAVSFWHNTLRRGEAPSEPGKLMLGFYGRIVVMQLTILFGGILMQALGSPIWALALLVVLKTGADLAAHLRERRRHAPPAQPAAAAASPSLS